MLLPIGPLLFGGNPSEFLAAPREALLDVGIKLGIEVRPPQMRFDLGHAAREDLPPAL